MRQVVSFVSKTIFASRSHVQASPAISIEATGVHFSSFTLPAKNVCHFLVAIILWSNRPYNPIDTKFLSPVERQLNGGNGLGNIALCLCIVVVVIVGAARKGIELSVNYLFVPPFLILTLLQRKTNVQTFLRETHNKHTHAHKKTCRTFSAR